MTYCPVDGDPDPKARGPQETPDKPKQTRDRQGGGPDQVWWDRATAAVLLATFGDRYFPVV